MTNYTELRDTIAGIGEGVSNFRHEVDEVKSENAQLRDRIEELESRKNSPGKTSRPGEPGTPAETWIDRKTGEIVPVLEHKDRLADLTPNKTGVSVGRYLRALLTGRYSDDKQELAEELKQLATAPDASGGYTVPAPLAAEFIDRLRAALVLSRAGARTVPMTTKTLSMAALATDAAAAWHAENASVTGGDPTFGVVTLSAKTVVGLVKLSLELSQDSINCEEMIARSLTGALAGAVDSAGLGNTVSNGPSGILSFTNRNKLTSVGGLTNYDKFVDAMGLLLASNVPLNSIGPIVLGTGAFTALAKLKTGLTSDNTPLQKPPALSMAFLPTTAVQSGSPQSSTAYMADWGDLLWGVRTELTIRVLNEVFLGSNLQLAVLAYLRCDFQPAREASFVTLEGISH